MDSLAEKLVEHLPAILQTVGWGLVVWGWWSIKKIFVRHSECQMHRDEIALQIAGLAKEQQDRDTAQQILREQLGRMPTAADIHNIAVGMETIKGDIKLQGDALRRLERDVSRLTDVHMGDGK